MPTAVQTPPVASRGRMTLEEFRALPEGPPNFEFERGRVIPLASPRTRHQDVVLELAHLMTHSPACDGEVSMGVDVFLPDGEHVYIPEICFVARPRLPALGNSDDKIHGAPDLVVEVTSSDPFRDRVEKFNVYFENGVPWYWIIDQEWLTVEEYQASPTGYLRTASIMPGAEFRPKLFEGLVINLSKLLPAPASK